MKKIALIAASAAALFAAPAMAQVGTNLIVNGNFENGSTGFTIAPGTDISIGSGADYVACCSATGSAAAIANHFAVFGGGNATNVSTLSQSFATMAGQAYQLSFDSAVFGSGSQSVTFALTGGIIGTGTVTSSAVTNLNTALQNHTYNFTAIGGLTTLSFTSAPQVGTNVDAVIDNVSVAAVPEPAAWAMMIVGMGAIGFAMRRRKVATRVSYAA